MLTDWVPDPCTLCAAADSDGVGDRDTRQSTNGSPVYWESKRQTVSTISFAEAEYVALSMYAQNLLCFRKLFWEITFALPWPDSIRDRLSFI